MTQTVGDVSLYVEEQRGGGPALVFLHYYGGSHRTWRKVLEALGGSFRTITYDCRGWGRSSPGGGYSIKELADDAQALIEQLGLQQYVLVGHSMGGKVTQLLASRRPAGLAGLILVAPAKPSPTNMPAEMAQTLLHAYDCRQNALEAINFLCAYPPDAEMVEQIVEDSLSGVPEAKRAWPLEAIKEDILGEVPRINVPTLLLAGEHDRLDPLDQHRQEVIPLIPGARLQIISGSGHLIPVDEPVTLAHAIKAFISDLKLGQN